MRNLKNIREHNIKQNVSQKVYINEHLTQKNGEIAAHARKLKKQNKIAATFVRNCSVQIKIEGETPEQSKIHTIRSMNDFSAQGLTLTPENKHLKAQPQDSQKKDDRQQGKSRRNECSHKNEGSAI